MSSTMIGRLQPHDLVRIDCSRMGDILTPEDPAAWPSIRACLRPTPFAVVRRAVTQRGMLPIGVRGEQRSQRFAAWLHPRGICQTIAPEMLRVSDDTRPMPAFQALRELERRMGPLRYPWGPTGSAGFELATGATAVTASSDLDLLVRATVRLAHREAQHIADLCVGLPCPVDIQIETPHGAFALREYLHSEGQVLLRTSGGPLLVDDPWHLPSLCLAVASVL
jgi:phosphoribosyl-dephospho-CoA transferase